MTSPPSPSCTQANLQRGKACISCRRRKIKCDGERPVCGQCNRTTRPEDCEYTDHQGRTRVEVLEENVARLQDRIRELESPQEVSAPVVLRQPQVRSWLQRHADPLQGLAAYGAWWESETPPQDVSRGLLNIFLPHSSQIGFALNIPRFLDTLDYPLEHPSYPNPALMHSIYLWALRLSNSDELTQHEPLYLTRALSALPLALIDPSPQQHILAVQTEVLLALYFFSVGRSVEGRYHASAAVSLSVSCRLHKIGAFPGDAHGTGLFDLSLPGTGTIVSPSQDATEDKERVDVFWTVYVMDRCWSVALGSSVVLSEDSSATQIDTPWPTDTEFQEIISTSERRRRTVQTFLSRQAVDVGGAEGTSMLALRAKASALFEYATRLTERQGPGQARSDSSNAEFSSLDASLANFLRTLAPMESSAALTPDSRRSFVVTYSLAQVSAIQLHHAFAGSNPVSRDRCLVAYRAIMRILSTLPTDEVQNLDPIIGISWLAVSSVLICEMKRLNAVDPLLLVTSALNEVEVDLEHIITAMEMLGTTFPFMQSQAGKVRELRDALHTSQQTE